MAVAGNGRFQRYIHDITNDQFRSKFEGDLSSLSGSAGIGVISDFEDQPLLIGSHLGTFGIVTVGRVNNMAEIIEDAFSTRRSHFSEMSGDQVNPTELVAMLINRGKSYEEGIRIAQEKVEGSCSMLLLTSEGVYAARDRYGRTPVVVGLKKGSAAATLETCAFPNLGYETAHYLGPGEIVRLEPGRFETLSPAGGEMKICAFLWVYYGYPASSYEGITVEDVRNRCGEALARRDDVEIDLVAGIPDSGTGHALGYAAAAGKPYRRPFVKYTPTWPRSFMPQDQRVRELVARMKLIPVRELIEGRRLLFCEDSIVRGTQLRDNVARLYESGATEVHMRPACPPLLRGCRYLNFSRFRSELDLAARRAIKHLEGDDSGDIPAEYYDPGSDRYRAMTESIRKRLNLTSLKYQLLDDLVEAIGLPREKLCTYCWNGME